MVLPLGVYNIVPAFAFFGKAAVLAKPTVVAEDLLKLGISFKPYMLLFEEGAFLTPVTQVFHLFNEVFFERKGVFGFTYCVYFSDEIFLLKFDEIDFYLFISC